jgi:proline iminopeptidase
VKTIAEINGTTLSYEEFGHGPACLMLHGGMGTDHTTLRGLEPLSDRLRLVTFDQRGTGRSGRPSLADLTIAQVADDAAALAGYLGHERVLVFGHSFGGFVAQELAVRRPELVAGLILAGTTAGQLGAAELPDDDQGPPPPRELTALLGKIVAEANTDAAFAAMMGEIMPYYLHRFDPRDFAELTGDAVFDVATFHATLALMQSWSVADRLDQVRAPVLLVVGRHDPVSSPAQAHRIARRVPEAEVAVFENSGHFPWLDEPEAFHDVLRTWLDRQQGH